MHHIPHQSRWHGGLASALCVLLLQACIYVPDNTFDGLGEGDVTAILVDEDGRTPAEGAVARLSGQSLQRVADKGGRVIFRNMPAGTFILENLWDLNGDGVPDRGARVAGLVRVAGGKRVKVDLGTVVLRPTATITGRVRSLENGTCDPGAAPPPDARVMVRETAATPLVGDRFELHGVLSGNHDVWAVAQGKTASAAGVAVSESGTTELPEVLCLRDIPATPAQVTGSLEAAPGAPELPARIRPVLVPAAGGTPVSSEQDRTGFTLQNVPQGVHELLIALPPEFLPFHLAWVMVPADGVALGELLAWPLLPGDSVPRRTNDAAASSSSSGPTPSSSSGVEPSSFSSVSSSMASSLAAPSSAMVVLSSSAVAPSSSLVTLSSSVVAPSSSVMDVLSSSTAAPSSMVAASSSLAPPSSEASSSALSMMPASSSQVASMAAPSSILTPSSSQGTPASSLAPSSAPPSSAAPSSSVVTEVVSLLSAVTLDRNGDGRLDAYRLTFSVPVMDSSFPGYLANQAGNVTTAWQVAGHAGVQFLSGVVAGDVANDAVVHIGFTPHTIGWDSGVKPELTTTASPGVTGLMGGVLAPVLPATVVETDGARPALVGAAARGSAALDAFFSEPVVATQATVTANYSLPGVTLSAPVLAGSKVSFTASTRATSGTLTALVGTIRDAAGNTITTPSNAASVVIPPGNDGTFQARTDYAAGTTAVSVATADLNANGIPDIVVSNYNSNSIGVFLGQGTGGRGTGVLGNMTGLAAGVDPGRIILGDFNADRITDAACANYTDNNLSIYLGQGSNGIGTGGFASRVNTASGSGALSATGGDFNDDGITDVLVANLLGTDYALFTGTGTNGRGDGAFTRTSLAVGTGKSPYFSLVGDFNRDGVQDVVLVLEAAGAVRVMLGTGSGGVGTSAFQAGTDYAVGAQPRNMDSADLNGDGIMDLVVANFGSANITLLLGNGANGVGDGTFRQGGNVAAATNPQKAVAVDLNNDGIVDLAYTNFGPDTMSVRLGNGSNGRGDGTFGAATDFPGGSNPRGIIAVDLDSDAVTDLVVANELSNNISTFRGTGGGRRGNAAFSTPVQVNAGTQLSHAAVADLDGNGWLDVVAADSVQDAPIQVFRGGATNMAGDLGLEAWTTVPHAGVAKAVQLKDLNGDGLQDLLVLNGTTNALDVLLGQGSNNVWAGTFAAAVSYAVGAGPVDMVAGHFNADDVVDVVVANAVAGSLSVLLGAGPAGKGNGTFLAATNVATCAGVAAVVAGDMNANAILDLVAVCPNGNAVAVLLGQGTGGRGLGTFVSLGQYATGTAPQQAVVRDLDHDGILDVVTVNKTLGNVSVLRGAGSGGVGTGALGAATNIVADGVAGTDGIAVADFDGDAIVDVATVNSTTGSVRIMKGGGTNGVGNRSFAGTSTITGTAKSLLVQDMNRDGVVDLVLTAPSALQVRQGTFTAVP